MIHNYNAELKYARLVAETANLTFKIGGVGSTPHTDGSYISMPPLDSKWEFEGEEYSQWWYALIHEAYHNLHREDFEIFEDEEKLKKLGGNSFLKYILNVCVDNKIETLNRGRFGGRDAFVAKQRYKFAVEKIYDRMGATSDAGGKADASHAVWVFDALARSAWIPEYLEDDLHSKLSDEAQVFLGTLLEEEGLFDWYSSQSTSEDSWELANKIHDLLLSSSPPPPPPPSEDEDQEKGESSEDEGESEGEDGGEGEGENSEDGGEEMREADHRSGEGDDSDDGEGGDGDGKDDSDSTSEGGAPDDGKTGKHDPDKRFNDFSEAATHDHEHFETRTSEDYTPVEEAYGEKWVSMPTIVHEWKGDTSVPTGARSLSARLEDTLGTSTNLSKQVRKELQSKSRQKYVGGHRSGKLHRKSMWKVACKHPSDRIFRQKSSVISLKGTEVMLLVDCSGSMAGDKYQAACASMIHLSKVLTEINVTHSVMGFTTENYDKNVMYPFKKFEEKVNKDKFIYRSACALYERGLLDNADGDCLMWAASVMRSRKASRKIIIVLSDGEPYARDAEGNMEYHFTENVVKDIEKTGDIEMYGIGILSRAVKSIYTNYEVLNHVNDLEPCLLNVLKNKFINTL